LGCRGNGIATGLNRRIWAKHPAKSRHIGRGREIGGFGVAIRSRLHDFTGIGKALPCRIWATGRIANIMGAEDSSGLKIAVLSGAEPKGQDDNDSDKLPQTGHRSRKRVNGDLSIHPRKRSARKCRLWRRQLA
jgi:hypothetical protein